MSLVFQVFGSMIIVLIAVGLAMCVVKLFLLFFWKE